MECKLKRIADVCKLNTNYGFKKVDFKKQDRVYTHSHTYKHTHITHTHTHHLLTHVIHTHTSHEHTSHTHHTHTSHTHHTNTHHTLTHTQFYFDQNRRVLVSRKGGPA